MAEAHYSQVSSHAAGGASARLSSSSASRTDAVRGVALAGVPSVSPITIEVGAIPAFGARSWIDWARNVVRELRHEARPSRPPSPRVLDAFDTYLRDWDTVAGAGETFQWRAADADQVEYLLHTFHDLDAHVGIECQRGTKTPAPPEGRLFYISLVQRLLDALSREGAARARFAEHLRSTWPGASGLLLRDRGA